ncbi:MAG TPA: ATP-binding protein [Syntrophales bacterium]|jgi:signal transduction histidine kinase|nr:ATP-binding protein [Syntrophales bacterium]HPX56095.1 ATP-binding protein [Syntrophales bacterium]HQA83168.1 ATP-binding protein [Syntrophales bacterium]
MKNEKKLIWQYHPTSDDRSPIQPLAVALACLVFIGLILVMGIMDIRRIDKTINDFIENRGSSVVSVLQSLAEENLNNLIKAYQHGNPDSLDGSQQRLNKALVEMGKGIDELWKENKLTTAYLQKFVSEQGLWYVGVMDREGRIIFESSRIELDIRSPENVTGEKIVHPFLDLRIFAQYAKEKKIGFIALNRKDGSGTVIIALDRAGLRYWGTRVSIEQAVEESGGAHGLGLIYMIAIDQTGKRYAQTGNVPRKWRPGDMPLAEILAGRQGLASRKVFYLGKQIMDVASPLKLNGEIIGVARLGLDRGNADRLIEENTRNMFVFMVLIVIIALLSMWLMYKNQKAHLAGIVEMERQLEKAERLSALGQLAAGVAHEIRNPLNAISMASQRLKRDYSPSDPEKMADFQTMTGVIRDEIRRLNGIIEEFLSFSKSRRLELREYPIANLIQKIIYLVREEAQEKGIVIHTQLPDDTLVIPMDMDKLQQALLNIIKNAMESIKQDGEITIAAGMNEKNLFRIAVTDTGCGMTREEVEKIFNPEYTTKEKGLGLGLTLAHEMIRGHGGEIRVWSQKNRGTTFEIFLRKNTKGQGKARNNETME